MFFRTGPSQVHLGSISDPSRTHLGSIPNFLEFSHGSISDPSRIHLGSISDTSTFPCVFARIHLGSPRIPLGSPSDPYLITLCFVETDHMPRSRIPLGSPIGSPSDPSQLPCVFPKTILFREIAYYNTIKRSPGGSPGPPEGAPAPPSTPPEEASF